MVKLLTPTEVSQLLRLPKRSIYRFAQEGHIPGGFRVGRHWRFRKEVIENWIAEQAGPRTVPIKK